MNVTAKVEGRENNIVTLEVVVPAAELDTAMDKAVKKVAKEVKIPGFRPGKVPKQVLMNYVGEAALLQEAFDEVLPESYTKAVDETGIFPVDRPNIDVTQLEKGKDITYKAIVIVKPIVTLGEYKGIEVPKVVAIPSDEDVDKEIKKMQERVGKIQDLPEDAAIEEGDMAVIDFEGFLDGVAFEGGKGDNYPLSIGSHTFIPGFEEQLVGKKSGEEVEVNVTFPEDYQNEELKGKPAVFKVKIHQVRRKELPALDDEFVKDVREDCDTVDELKAKIKEELTEKANKTADDVAKRDVMNKVVENATVDIPGVMIEDRIDQLVQEFETQLKYQGLDLNSFFKFAKTDMDGLREQNRKRAEFAVKQDLVLEAIVEAENIEATEEDFEEQLKEIAESYHKDVEELRDTFNQPDNRKFFAYNIKMMKAVDFINDNAVIQ